MSAPAKKGSIDAQEKDLMLDKDMEKDAWNFKSMTDDDPMDFGFDSPAKNKKNAFKLDMGFDLDGDFGNLSSFKMDMPNFDFSSPAKKTTKKNEGSNDKSSGNSKQKKKPFAFSYDFDALDDFDLDSSPLKKGSDTTTKTKDCEKTASQRKTDKSDALDFGPAGSMETTDVNAKASGGSENQSYKTAYPIGVDSIAHSKQVTLKGTENFELAKSPQPQRPMTSTSKTYTVCFQPQSTNTSPLKTASPIEELGELCLSNETAAPSPLHASGTVHEAVNRETTPDIHEICRSASKEDYPRDTEQNDKNKMISSMESSYENSASNISCHSGSEKMEDEHEEMDTGTQAEIQDHSRGPSCYPDAGQSQTALSRKISPGPRPSQTAQVQDSSANLPSEPSYRHDNEDPSPVSRTRRGPTEIVNMDSEMNAADTNTGRSHEKIIHKDHPNARR